MKNLQAENPTNKPTNQQKSRPGTTRYFINLLFINNIYNVYFCWSLLVSPFKNVGFCWFPLVEYIF